MNVTGIGSHNTYYYNVDTKRLQSSETGEENEFCQWFNGDLSREQLSDSINGYDSHIKDDLEEMFYMYNEQLKVDVFQPSKNGNLCEISVNVLDAESVDCVINGKTSFRGIQVVGYNSEEEYTMRHAGPYKNHTAKAYNPADNSINIAVGDRYKLPNGYQIAVRDDWIEVIGYSKGEAAYDPELECLIGGLNDLIRFADQQWTSGSISDESMPILLNFLRRLGIDTSREFIINDTKCELVNGRISEVGNTYGAPSSIYQKAIARYEEWLYQPMNKKHFEI